MKALDPTPFSLAALLLILPATHVSAQVLTSTNAPMAPALQRLQGAWEGTAVGQESEGKVRLTFKGQSLSYIGADTNQAYEASFTLPPGKKPAEMHTRITRAPQTNDIGSKIRVIYKFEHDTLVLSGIPDEDPKAPKTAAPQSAAGGITDGLLELPGLVPGTSEENRVFEENTFFRYKLRKVEVRKPDPKAQPPKSADAPTP